MPGYTTRRLELDLVLKGIPLLLQVVFKDLRFTFFHVSYLPNISGRSWSGEADPAPRQAEPRPLGRTSFPLLTTLCSKCSLSCFYSQEHFSKNGGNGLDYC